MGAGELFIVVVVGLLVLGPERLPKAIRSVYKTIRSIRQFANTMTTELDEELRIKELHQHLKQAEQQGFKNLSPEVKNSVEELKAMAESVQQGYRSEAPIVFPKESFHSPLNNQSHDSASDSTTAQVEDKAQASAVSEKHDVAPDAGSTTTLESISKDATKKET